MILHLNIYWFFIIKGSKNHFWFFIFFSSKYIYEWIKIWITIFANIFENMSLLVKQVKLKKPFLQKPVFQNIDFKLLWLQSYLLLDPKNLKRSIFAWFTFILSPSIITSIEILINSNTSLEWVTQTVNTSILLFS